MLDMDKPPHSTNMKHIAIAIELDYAYPWHQDCYQGILKYAEQKGDWLCIVDPFLVGLAEGPGGRSYDAAVGRIDFTTAQIAKSHGIPLVNHWANSPVEDLPSVLINDTEVGKMAGEHLLSCGYQRFAFTGILDNRPGDHQLAGLTEVVTSHGYAPPDAWMYSIHFEEDREHLSRFRKELIAWLSSLKPPVGIAAINATAARYIAQVCYELGLDIPTDVGIVVLLSDYSSDTGSPSITSVEQDYLQLGYAAARLLDEQMQGKARHPLQRLHMPTRLIQRDSTDVFLCDDPLVTEAMHFIAEHCRQTLKVEDVADALHTSVSTLRRRFEQALGKQVKDEIARLRTDHVKSLLTESDKSLTQIAEECGYSSPTQFGRYFSNAVGMTPSAYRERFQTDTT